MKIAISLVVNGQSVNATVEPRLSLADLLREELRLTATHLGCEHGVCGACTVLIDGEPARACLALVVANEGADVRTLEGLANDAVMKTIKTAFHQEHGLQCGFCTPGMLVTAWDLLKRNSEITEADVRTGISGNLCRCTGYQGIVRAVLSAARELRSTIGGSDRGSASR
jgi:carbon-monoxide dehydrogenase small subunit